MSCIQGELRNPKENMCLDSAVRPDDMHKPVRIHFCSFHSFVQNIKTTIRLVCGPAMAKEATNTGFSARRGSSEEMRLVLTLVGRRWEAQSQFLISFPSAVIIIKLFSFYILKFVLTVKRMWLVESLLLLISSPSVILIILYHDLVVVTTLVMMSVFLKTRKRCLCNFSGFCANL